MNFDMPLNEVVLLMGVIAASIVAPALIFKFGLAALAWDDDNAVSHLPKNNPARITALDGYIGSLLRLLNVSIVNITAIIWIAGVLLDWDIAIIVIASGLQLIISAIISDVQGVRGFQYRRSMHVLSDDHNRPPRHREVAEIR